LYVSVFAGTEVSDDVSEDASGDVSEDVSKDVSTVLEDEFLAPGNFCTDKKYNCRPHNYCAGQSMESCSFQTHCKTTSKVCTQRNSCLQEYSAW
jgi:hypothetical protein